MGLYVSAQDRDAALGLAPFPAVWVEQPNNPISRGGMRDDVNNDTGVATGTKSDYLDQRISSCKWRSLVNVPYRDAWAEPNAPTVN
jgi:hypothetical protein